MVKHLNELAGSLKDHEKAVFLQVFQYRITEKKERLRSTHYEEVSQTFRNAAKAGVEFWEIQLDFRPEGVALYKVTRSVGLSYVREHPVDWNVYRPGCSEHYVLHVLRDDPAFIKELIPEYLDGVTGVYQTPQGYYVDDYDVEKFDKGFPVKKKLKLPGQIIQIWQKFMAMRRRISTDR